MAEVKIAADSGGGSVSLKGPASTTGNANVDFKLPVADGSANQVLKTDGSKNFGWTNAGIAASHIGVAKAWISLDIDGSDGNRDSYNIASFTDHGTGDFTLTFDTDFANTTYVAVITNDLSSYDVRWTSSTSGSHYGEQYTMSDRAVGSCRFQNLNFSSTNGDMKNATNAQVVLFGDQ